MEYEDLIEDEEGPIGSKSDTELESDTISTRAKSPWKAFILTGLIASLIGGAGGGYGVFIGLKTQGPKTTVAPTVDLASLNSKISRLTARIEAAEASLKAAKNEPAPTSDPIDLSGLEARLDALESAPSPEIDPEALTALKSAQEDGFDWPDTSNLETRLSELETKLEAKSESEMPEGLETRLAALESDFQTALSEENISEENSSDVDDMRAVQIEKLEARLTALENRPAPAPKIERISLLAFPKAAMITAVEDNLDGGLFKKTLSRHIRVKDEDDPIALIEAIEADIAKGHLRPAAEKFERLPEPIRAEGQAWYESVKASL